MSIGVLLSWASRPRDSFMGKRCFVFEAGILVLPTVQPLTMVETRDHYFLRRNPAYRMSRSIFRAWYPHHLIILKAETHRSFKHVIKQRCDRPRDSSHSRITLKFSQDREVLTKQGAHEEYCLRQTRESYRRAKTNRALFVDCLFRII